MCTLVLGGLRDTGYIIRRAKLSHPPPPLFPAKKEKVASVWFALHAALGME